jgi:hypothetical protein
VAIIPRKIYPNLAINQICRTNLQLFFNISDYLLKPNVGIWWLFAYFFPHLPMIEIKKVTSFSKISVAGLSRVAHACFKWQLLEYYSFVTPILDSKEIKWGKEKTKPAANKARPAS